MKYFLVYLIFIMSFSISAQNVMPLYEGKIPNSKDVPNKETSVVRENGTLIISYVTQPTLTSYLPEEGKATGQAVIICPGGGYGILAASHEGEDVAKEFQEKGIAGFVLKYRLPNDTTMVDKTIGPLQDAQKAIRTVRENAEKWNIDPDKIGIMGFSAGGHLASTAGTQYNREVIDNPSKTSLRPDFMVLVYPVVSFDTLIGHSGSAKNLLGSNPTREAIHLYSNEMNVTKDTPPTYLVHAKDDNVSIKNSYVFEAALKESDVPVATTYFESGGHGFGLINSTSDIKWLDEVEKWIRKNF